MKKRLYYFSMCLLIISLFSSSCNSLKNDTNLFPIAVGNKMGFIDSTGKVVIECKYDYVGKFNEGLAIAVIDSMYGYIDLSGAYKIKPKYNLMKHIQWGSNDVDGVPEKNPQIRREMFLSHLKSHPDTIYNYDIPDIYDFHEGLAVYYDKGKYGYLGTDGRQVIKARYTYAKVFSEGLAAVKYNSSSKLFGESLYGYINKEDKFIISPQYTNANNFSEGKSAVGIVYNYIDKTTGNKLYNIKLFAINKAGNILFTPNVQGILDFKEGYAKCFDLAYQSLKGTGYNYIDSNGKYYVPYDKLSFANVRSVSNITDSIKYFNGKLFLVQVANDDKWGFLPEDLSTHKKSSAETFIYDNAYPFSENLAAVKINDLWGYIDPLENITIKPIYTKAENFRNGLAYVEQNENGFKLSGYINKRGIMIWSNKSLEKQM